MSKCFFIWSRRVRYIIVMTGLLSSCIVLVPTFTQAQEIWTLERSVQRVLEISPEAKTALVEIDARQARLSQAGVWPNPEIELRADDRIGKDDSTGGNDLTQFVLNQPLPLSGRLGYQRDMAEAELNSAQAERRYQHLLLEKQAARRFHSLQLATAHLRLAEQRLQLADKLQEAGRRREQAGEMAKMERLRLDLIRESAQQNLDQIEGKFNEALSQFRAYLVLPEKMVPELVPLEPFGQVPVLKTLQAELSEHPALLSANYRLAASRAGVDLVQTERMPDPVLSLYRELDNLNGRRQNINGIGINITVPLWDRKSGRLREARFQVDKAQFSMQALKRDLSSRLQQAHLHLSHLVRQGVHYRSRVFEPAHMLFDLTRKAYAGGEADILSLIDANDTYFDAHERYLELLQEAWLEAAELRLSADRALVIIDKENQL